MMVAKRNHQKVVRMHAKIARVNATMPSMVVAPLSQV